MSFLELANLWDVSTPLGDGKALFIESKDNDYYWNVVLNASGGVVAFPQAKIRVKRAYTLGIAMTDDLMREFIARDGC
jgi:hypothetical protein